MQIYAILSAQHAVCRLLFWLSWVAQNCLAAREFVEINDESLKKTVSFSNVTFQQFLLANISTVLIQRVQQYFYFTGYTEFCTLIRSLFKYLLCFASLMR